MAIRAGRLGRRVLLQQPNTAADSTGQVAGYVDVATVWAAVEPARGRELLGSSTGAQTITKEVDALIILRYRADVKATWRIVHDGDVYGIVALVTPLSRKRTLEMACRRVDTGQPS